MVGKSERGIGGGEGGMHYLYFHLLVNVNLILMNSLLRHVELLGKDLISFFFFLSIL